MGGVSPAMVVVAVWEVYDDKMKGMGRKNREPKKSFFEETKVETWSSWKILERS